MVVGWRDTWPGVIRKSALRWSSASHWRARSLVARGLSLPELPQTPGSVWAIAMVKNEADIIEATVTHTFAQGVDQMLIVDNQSTDGTGDLLRGLAKQYPLHIGSDREIGYFQAHKMSALAAHVRRAGGRWVVPFDADEFWFAREMSVAEYLRNSSGTRVEADIYNVFPTRASPTLTGLASDLRLDLRPHLLRKVATRTHPLLWIGVGNHSALRPGTSDGGLRILHLPWRNRAQLKGKLRQGAEAYRATDIRELGGHWRSLGAHEETALDRLWDELLDGRADPSLGWRPVGPFTSVSPDTWKSWDPDHVVPDGLAVQKPTF